LLLVLDTYVRQFYRICHRRRFELATLMVPFETICRAAKEANFVQARTMEQRNKHGLADAVTFDSGLGTTSGQTRRTAAIEVLTRALLSPPLSIANETTTEAAASNTAAAAVSAARSFLNTTCSVYVLDADTSASSITNSTPNGSSSIVTTASLSPSNTIGQSSNNDHNANMPKLFGCWNFLHQAMNEIERFEDEQNHLAAQNKAPVSLLPQTRLLAEFAVKVARRSDDLDRQKVATCVENFCISTSSNIGSDSSGNDQNNETNDSQVDQKPKGRLDAKHVANNINVDKNNGHNDINIILPHLVRANAEIREIVTGRIAAFSFNENPPSPSQHSCSSSTVFADPLVVETFCRFLAANAVSNGTERLRRFLDDWIIPGATVDTTCDGPTCNPLLALNTISGAEGNKRQRLSPERSSRYLHHRLPPYSLACVLYHVAVEAETIPLYLDDSLQKYTDTARTISPLGTIDVLQRLSLPVMANVLLRPVLHDSLQRKQMKRQLKQQQKHLQQQQQQQSSVGGKKNDDDADDMDDRIIAMGLKAILKWCSATGLSLAQTKHIGSKVQVNLSHLLGEALQTDSPIVMNALADLIEDVVERHVVPQPPTPQERDRPKQKHRLISKARMTQTRYLMQVPDEVSFLANVTEEQLHIIETKELGDMLTELSVEVEGQRFRFPSFGMAPAKPKDNSSKKPLHGAITLDTKMHSMGHALARIATAVCLGISKVDRGDISTPVTTGVAMTAQASCRLPTPGYLELLSTCASHPSVGICATVLPVITPILKTQVGLATQWLQTLQRRAIIPHHPNNTAILSASTNKQASNPDGTYIPLLAASDVCFVEFEEFFYSFRETVLADALHACYTSHSEYYLASCTAAIEEFCVGDVATEQTSFHLEAALFCLAIVSEQVLPSVIDSTGTCANSPVPAKKGSVNASSYLLRCTAALAKKPKSLNNPLTMAQACQFMRKYAKWFGSSQQHSGILDISADLTLYILVQCASEFPDAPLSSTIQKETGLSPYSEAAKTLRCLLCNNGRHFLSNKAIAALGAGWEATFAACNRGGKLLTLEDRKDTCIGICHVLAALPKDQQQTSLVALALASIACLEAMVERAESVGFVDEKGSLELILDRAADEINILVTTASAFTEAIANANTDSEGCRGTFVEPSMMVLRRAWKTITIVASKYSFHDSVLESLRFLFAECMPMNYESEDSISFLQNICALAHEVIKNDAAQQRNNRFFSPVLHFVDGFSKVHGSAIDKVYLSKQQSGESFTTRTAKTIADEKMYQCVDSLARETIQSMIDQSLLGNDWVIDRVTQGNGQSAFETTKKSEASSEAKSPCQRSGFASFFSFLSTSTIHCPAFLLHVLASAGLEVSTAAHDTDSTDSMNDDSANAGVMVFRKALVSAVSSIIDVDSEISINAIAFLESVKTVASKSRTENSNDNTTTRRLAGEYNLRFQSSMLSVLLRGTCGVFQPFVIPRACRLLFHALSESFLTEEEFKAIALKGLSQDHFFLGNRARNVVYECCLLLLKKSNTAPSLHKLENMMTDVWRFHRFENIDTIQQSDAINAFCIGHGSN